VTSVPQRSSTRGGGGEPIHINTSSCPHSAFSLQPETNLFGKLRAVQNGTTHTHTHTHTHSLSLSCVCVRVCVCVRAPQQLNVIHTHTHTRTHTHTHVHTPARKMAALAEFPFPRRSYSMSLITTLVKVKLSSTIASHRRQPRVRRQPIGQQGNTPKQQAFCCVFHIIKPFLSPHRPVIHTNMDSLWSRKWQTVDTRAQSK